MELNFTVNRDVKRLINFYWSKNILFAYWEILVLEHAWMGQAYMPPTQLYEWKLSFLIPF